MLQTINRFEPLLAHYADSGALHPGELYQVCVSAAGELATFTTTSKRPPKFPGYRHDRLRESFEPVIASLRASLSVVLDQSAIAIPLEAKKFGISVAIVTDRTLYSTAVLRPGGARRRSGRRAAPALSGAAQDRAGREDRRPRDASDCPACRCRRCRLRRGRSRFTQDSPISSSIRPATCGDQLKTSGGVALHVAGEFPGLRWNSGRFAAACESERMADIDDPFNRPDGTAIRPRPGAGKRGSNEATAHARGPPSASSQAPSRSPPRARDWLGVGLNPLVQAASPLLLLAGQLRGSVSSPWMSPGSGSTRSTRCGGSRNARAAAGVPNEIVLAARYVLCAALDEAVLVHTLGRSERVGAAPAARDPAPRSMGRREVLRDARSSLARSRPPHRPDGAAVSLLAFGFAGKYQVQDRGHERLADVQQDLYRKIRNHRGAPIPSCRCAGAVSKTAATRSSATCPWWVVGAAALALAGDRLHRVLRTPGQPSRRRSTRSSRKSGSRIRWSLTPPPAPRSDAQAAAGDRRIARSVMRDRGRRRTHCRHAACARPVRVRERDGEPRLRRRRCGRIADGAEPGARPRAGRRGTPTISRCDRCGIRTTSSCPASGR